MNYNKAFILGNLTRDPELRTTPSGQSVVNFGVATNRIWNDKNGQRQTDVEFHNVVAFGRLAEIANQYLSKGSLIFVEGRIKTRTWEDQSGQKRYRTEIIAEGFQMGPRRQGQDVSGASVQSRAASEVPEINIEEEEVNPEEIPF